MLGAVKVNGWEVTNDQISIMVRMRGVNTYHLFEGRDRDEFGKTIKEMLREMKTLAVEAMWKEGFNLDSISVNVYFADEIAEVVDGRW